MSIYFKIFDNFFNQHQTIEGVPDSLVVHPDLEKVKQHIERQREKGLIPPVVTLLVEIGRPLQNKLESTGINREPLYPGDSSVHEPVDAISRPDEDEDREDIVGPEIRKKLIHCHYRQNDGTFFDVHHRRRQG